MKHIKRGFYGNNSTIAMEIALPNSDIKYWVLLVKYSNQVNFHEFYGHGVKPDFEISYNYEDYQDTEDRILKKSIELLNNASDSTGKWKNSTGKLIKQP